MKFPFPYWLRMNCYIGFIALPMQDIILPILTSAMDAIFFSPMTFMRMPKSTDAFQLAMVFPSDSDMVIWRRILRDAPATLPDAEITT